MIFIFIWIGLCFLVALAGTEKSLGYWGTFFISLLLSPLLGLIIALVSGSRIKRKVSSNFSNLNLALKAENRGDIKEAWKYYMDALFDIKNAPKSNNKYVRNYRTKQIAEIESKIKEINDLEHTDAIQDKNID
jgi:phosphate/sulfate permease